jgi:hypothetical protein
VSGARPRRIAELPFARLDPLEALNLQEERALPDPDFAGYGWCRVSRIWLLGADGDARPVDDAAVLALHTPDDAEPAAGDLELEFVLDPKTGESVLVALSAFLAAWLPRVVDGARAVVLAVCNPHRVLLPRPAAAGAATVHAPLGDVTSWLVDGALQLRATSWNTLPPEHA